MQTAIRLAKKMIISGEMPAPETARAQLEFERKHQHLGEPFVMDAPAEPAHVARQKVPE